MNSKETHQEPELLYWEELSPVDNCPINICIVQGNRTLTKLHTHAYLEIALVVSGSGGYCTPSEEFSLKEGDLFLLLPGDSHAYSWQSGLVVYNLLLKDYAVLQQFHEILNDPALRYFFQLEPRFRHKDHFQRHIRLNFAQRQCLVKVFEEMREELKEQEPQYRDMLTLLLRQLFILISRCCRSLSKDKENDQLYSLAKILRYIEVNLSNTFVCKQLAKQANMGERSFYRYFKAATGLTPMDYVIHLRLQKARQMLRSTNLSVKSIAYECGFCDCSYFAQKFRRTFHETPLHFRKGL